MVGRPLHKIYCESMTRRSNFTVQCRAKGNLMKSGKYRCKNHGGMSLSNGQRTFDGKIKAMMNLRPFKNKTYDEVRKILGPNFGTTPAWSTTHEDSKEQRHAWTIDNL